MRSITILAALASVLIMASCKKEEDPAPTPPGPRLILKFKFDSTQVRLNNLGNPEPMEAGHAGQSPRFNAMSAHYVEFAPDMWTPLGSGDVLYHAPETSAGGATAIDFSQGIKKGDGEAFLNVALSDLAPGTYEWLRVSLAYQNYDIDFKINQPIPLDLSGTIASFIGYNSYIGSFPIKDSLMTVNDDRLQGFWAFETQFTADTGSAPPGSTTVPNPINGTSPIPAGSCVVTGEFAAPLTITGNETSDVVITVSLSTNKSFEWIDDGDGIFEPAPPELEQVVDMGVRGLVPIVQ